MQRDGDPRDPRDDANREPQRRAVRQHVPEDVHRGADQEEGEEERDRDLEKRHRLRERFHRELRHPDHDEREEREHHAAELAVAELPARAHVHAPAQALRSEEGDPDAGERDAGLHRPMDRGCVPREVVEEFAERRDVEAHGLVGLAPCFARSITAAKKPSVW